MVWLQGPRARPRTRPSCWSRTPSATCACAIRSCCCTKAGSVSRAPTTSCCTRTSTESIEAIYGGYQHASATGEFVGFDEDRSGELPPAARAARAQHRAAARQPQPAFHPGAPPKHPALARQGADLAAPRRCWSAFPALVAIFATNGLPQVRSMSLQHRDQHRRRRWPTRSPTCRNRSPPPRSFPAWPCSRSSCSRSWARTTARAKSPRNATSSRRNCAPAFRPGPTSRPRACSSSASAWRRPFG